MNELINYKLSGQGPPLLIMHGLFGSMDNWRSIAGNLNQRFTVITVDLRNHGRSFWSDQFSYELLAIDILDLLDHLNIPACTVLGHSMGGKVAFYLAQFFPQRVTRLIVLDIGYKAYPPGHLEIFKAVLQLDLKVISSRSEADKQLARSIRDMSVRQFLLKSLKRNTDMSFSWKTNFQGLYDNYDRILSAIEIDRIQTPTLVIRGSKSAYITDEDVEDLQQKLPNVRFATLDAGHWLHAEKPEELLKEITDFLN